MKVRGASDTVEDLVLDSPEIGEFLEDLCHRAAAALSTPGSEIHCAVLLLRPGARTILASSSPEARAMDEIQVAYDDGPSLRAVEDQWPCLVEDFRAETRFGGYAQEILRTGVHSSVGVPIALDGTATAAMNFHSMHPGGFDLARCEMAVAFADRASRALRTAVRIAQLTDTAAQPAVATDISTTILLAAGVIMGLDRCSHDTAITLLRAASSTRNTELEAVAAAVLRSIGQETPDAHVDL